MIFFFSNIRECLKLDPDHKKCSDFYKKLKKLSKFLDNMKRAHDEQRYDECINSANKVIDFDSSSNKFVLKSETYICICQSKVSV
jgi:DnaJ family protein C protein 3